MSTSRREIREKALQSLFQLASSPEMDPEYAMQSALTSELDIELTEEDEEIEIPAYLRELVFGVREHQDEIDALISEHLRNWSMSRLAKTDLLILRIAVYELMYQPELAANIVMNEAIEITKDYSDEDASKFVNGVLSSIHKEDENKV